MAMNHNNLNSSNNAYDFVSLESWIKTRHSEDEMREVFLNMDRAMKYVHDRGYCVKSFHPKEIELINRELNQIRFRTLLEMPSSSLDRKRYIKEDIYNSSYIQIGIYTKCLYWLNQNYLKENFDSFAQFLPEGDVPYYRGVIERGASVYLCEYDLEKRKRDLAALEKEVGGEGVPTDTAHLNKVDVNEDINSVIYRQINKRSDAAYVYFLVYPAIMFTISIIIAVIVKVLSLS